MALALSSHRPASNKKKSGRGRGGGGGGRGRGLRRSTGGKKEDFDPTAEGLQAYIDDKVAEAVAEARERILAEARELMARELGGAGEGEEEEVICESLSRVW